MKKHIVIIAGLLVATGMSAPADVHAQFGVQPPKTWISVYGLMYTGISGMADPGSQSQWVFDDNAFGAGVTLHRQVGRSLMLGLDGSLARPQFERHTLDDDETEIDAGNASIATAMATGRYGYSGGGDIGFYLAGGIGTVAYKLGELGWNPDFALQAGTGLEYRFSTNKAVALEWGRTWGYHEKEDLGGGSQTHSALKLALRIGF